MRKLAMGVVWTLVALLVLAAVLLAVLNRPDISYAELARRHGTAASRFADLPGGVRMHYQEFGPADRPTIVLVHGYGDSFMTWRQVVERLGARYHVVVPDLPGHGLTDAPAGLVTSSASYVAVLDALVDKLQLKRFTLVGNSMGGGVSWRYALAHPEKLDGLVLVDASGWPAKSAAKPPLAMRILSSAPGRWYLEHFETRWVTGPALKADFHDPSLVTKELLDNWVEVQRAPGHRRILMAVGAGPQSPATAEKLAALNTPTLIVHGADDRIIAPAAAEKFHAAIRGSELNMYPATGHLPQRERPEQLSADIARFVDAHAGAAGQGAGQPAPPKAR